MWEFSNHHLGADGVTVYFELHLKLEQKKNRRIRAKPIEVTPKFV